MSYVTMSALCEEITRHVGGLEKQRAITGKKTEETWKADAKPAEKEPKWELLFRKASPLLLKSAHLPCSFLANSLQVTLSYGVFESKLNVIELSGPFSSQEDPSRYRS